MSYVAGMAEHRPFEAAALGLGYALGAQGYVDLAAALLEVVPTQGIVQDDALRALIDERLHKIAAAGHVTPQLRQEAAHAATLPSSAASVDPASRDGRVGTVWIAWTVWNDFDDDASADAGGEDGLEPCYWVSRQSNDPGYNWCEDGPGHSPVPVTRSRGPATVPTRWWFARPGTRAPPIGPACSRPPARGTR